MYVRLLPIVSLFGLLLNAQAQLLPQDSLRLSRIANDSARILETASLGADLIYTGKSYQQAATYLTRAETAAARTGSAWLKAHVVRRWGDLEWAADHLPAALSRFQEAEQAFVRLAEAGGPNVLQSRHYVLFMKLRIAQVLISNNDLPQTERSLRAALHYASQHRLASPKDLKIIASVYGEQSILAKKQGQLAKALALNDTARLKAKQAGAESDYYGYVLNGAILRKDLKQYAEAVRDYEACAAYFTRQKDDYALTIVYGNLPRALLGLKRYDEGIAYAQKAIAMADKTGYRLSVQSDVYEALSLLYEAKGQPQQALTAFRRSKAQQDTLFTQDKERQVQELTAKYEAATKETQIRELEAKANQRTWQLASLGVGALLLALLLGVSLYQSKQLRRGSRRISRQADQLQLLMKELHHRAKNNLAIVSGLLALQARRTDDPFTRQAFLEGQQRIDAMALIHQRLYQTEALTTINLNEYVDNLVNSLMHTYGYTRDTLDLRLVLKAESIEADTAIPLGLIINEVLTNVFKYAYREVAHPSLQIRLEQDQDQLNLDINDNGPGLDLAAWQRADGSFGKQLIRSLSAQLDAQLTVDNQQGTWVSLRVPIGEAAFA